MRWGKQFQNRIEGVLLIYKVVSPRSKKGSQELASLQEGTSLLKPIGIVENPRGLRTKPTRFNSPSAFFQPDPFFPY